MSTQALQMCSHNKISTESLDYSIWNTFYSFGKSFSFNYFALQAYGRDLMEAQDWCRKYMRSGNVKDLTQAWDLYYHVFRRISKQLPQVSETMESLQTIFYSSNSNSNVVSIT